MEFVFIQHYFPKILTKNSNKKNITIQNLQDYFLQQEDVFAFSFHNSNYYYLKDVDFFKENHFSYIGELKLEKNKIIVFIIPFFIYGFLQTASHEPIAAV